MASTAFAAASTYSPPARPSAGVGRIAGIDVLRGLVMVLMAIDHVRVYSGVPAGGPTAGVFFTRWVTHFCAPAFVFFAGTAAFLYGHRLGDPKKLSRYLATRGLLLVLLELTLIHVSWTFTLDWGFVLGGVIWMLGLCMILMAGLVRFSAASVGLFGIAVMVLQTLMRVPARFVPSLAPLWSFLYTGGSIQLGKGGPDLEILYNIIPWIGVMAAGYGFGLLLLRDPDERRRLCLRLGLGATVAFLLIAGTIAMLRSGNDNRAFIYSLLDQNKYRDSQLFLLMTLGPMIALLPFADDAKGKIARAFETFGRVPLFYYLLHIPLIHALSLITWRLRDGAAHGERFATAPYVQLPPDQRWGLGLLYLVFAITIAILYPVCRWYAGLKGRRPGGLLRYI
jgi:uncharacterized membrane protein